MSAFSEYRSPRSTSGAVQRRVPTPLVMVSSKLVSRLSPKSLTLAWRSSVKSTLSDLRSRCNTMGDSECKYTRALEISAAMGNLSSFQVRYLLSCCARKCARSPSATYSETMHKSGKVRHERPTKRTIFGWSKKAAMRISFVKSTSALSSLSPRRAEAFIAEERLLFAAAELATAAATVHLMATCCPSYSPRQTSPFGPLDIFSRYTTPAKAIRFSISSWSSQKAASSGDRIRKLSLIASICMAFS
ncbi:hypothetical protein F441_21394 [Phytophthora nicotianae CJ01A1]|uniref:Uncharacterized protein n=3 Tax=Phytophthora nicotianae TaxID=4792 RepID=V9DXE1_PHYNI|nr:hypothetical protein F443_21513 [Phytophthora nicotianae P1569]ETO60238.1 hypothetical protein F444_21523 [Phytophthora nicotianae P1976]ETP01339.1 hypothetical protein F441_21394 [Phytophthora nicotianae CJ01A1]